MSPLAGWVIAITNGKHLLGKRMPEGGSVGMGLRLSPVYEMRTLELVGQVHPQAPPMIQPAGWAVGPLLDFGELTWVDVPECAIIIDATRLDEKAQASLMQGVERVQKAVSAAGAGIVLAGAMPQGVGR